MKILFIPFRYFENPIGGVEVCVRHITASLKSNGHKITVIATSVNGKESFRIIDGIELYKFPFWNYLHFFRKGDRLFKMVHLKEILRFPYIVFKMWAIFLRKKPDVVNMHFAGPQSAALLVLFYVMRFKFILTLHGLGTQHLNNPRIFRWSKLLFKILLKKADFIIAPSRSLIEDAIRREPGVKQKCKVIPNGVDVNEFTIDYRIANYIDSDKVMRRYIYSDYKYWPNKDYGLLLFAYKAILDLGYDINLVLSIAGGERHKYNKIFNLLGLGQRVKLIDYSSTIDRRILLKGSDCYISLSKGSFCDFITLEALSLDIPAIADTRNDIRKIGNEHDGVVFIDTDEESKIVFAIERLLKQQRRVSQRRVSPYILTVCSLYRYKGVSTLIKAFKKVSMEYPGLTLLIAGDGDQRELLERFSERVGLKDKVIFLGAANRCEVIRLFKGCEFFVLPSWIEPFGIVNLEAMAGGKAIIASCVDGIEEVVKNDFNGILVEPRNSNALKEAMMKLLDDKELRDRLGRNGRKTVQDPKFSWDNIAGQYIEVYRKVLQER